MNIIEIYDQYKINKGLREHMVRVAAVARLIADNMTGMIETESVVKACLLHDMGNLIKAKITSSPEMFEPEGVEYWSDVQQDMKNTYGNDVYGATNDMVSKITNDQKIRAIIDEMSFDQIEEIAQNSTVEVKLALYSDMRVGFHGVISLNERFDDIGTRYIRQGRFTAEDLERRRSAAKFIENDIFSQNKLSPEDVNDETIAELETALWQWEVN